MKCNIFFFANKIIENVFSSIMKECPNPSLSHFVRELMERDGTFVEGLVKGQIKPALTVMSIKPGGQRLLSEQYLSL